MLHYPATPLDASPCLFVEAVVFGLEVHLAIAAAQGQARVADVSRGELAAGEVEDRHRGRRAALRRDALRLEARLRGPEGRAEHRTRAGGAAGELVHRQRVHEPVRPVAEQAAGLPRRGPALAAVAVADGDDEPVIRHLDNGESVLVVPRRNKLLPATQCVSADVEASGL